MSISKYDTGNLTETAKGKSMITREKAEEIAIKYLGAQMLGRIQVTDKLPTGGVIYGRDSLSETWVAQVPSPENFMHVGGGRIICISNSTGKIVYDGSDGGE